MLGGRLPRWRVAGGEGVLAQCACVVHGVGELGEVVDAFPVGDVFAQVGTGGGEQVPGDVDEPLVQRDCVEEELWGPVQADVGQQGCGGRLGAIVGPADAVAFEGGRLGLDESTVDLVQDLVRVAERAVAVRREAQRIGADQVELGVTTLLARKVAEAALAEAETQQLEAQLGLRLAQAELARTLGR